MTAPGNAVAVTPTALETWSSWGGMTSAGDTCSIGIQDPVFGRSLAIIEVWGRPSIMLLAIDRGWNLPDGWGAPVSVAIDGREIMRGFAFSGGGHGVGYQPDASDIAGFYDALRHGSGISFTLQGTPAGSWSFPLTGAPAALTRMIGCIGDQAGRDDAN
jgi:hypothetical protein